MTRYSQHFVTGLVVLTWLVMTAQAYLLVARYGQNLPRQDEWEFVPALYGHEAPLPWIFARHYEHRYPLARAVYLTLHTVTGQDFRAGMWVSVTLLSVSAGVLLLAARKSRGRCDLLDLFIPVLLLNAGHVENFTMGYQIAFTLTIAWLTVFLAAVVWSDRLGSRRVALLCGVATLCVALGGAIGWVFVPVLGLFTIGRAVEAARLSPRRIGNASLLTALPVLAGVYVAASVVELKLSGASYPNNNLTTALGVAFDFWTVSLGGAGQVGYPLPGIVALGCVVEALVFVAVTFATRPAERVRVSGCAAVLVGVVMISIVIGVTRPLGNESRYALFGGLGLCVIILMHAVTSPTRPLGSPGLLLIPVIAGLIAWQDWQVGVQFSHVYAMLHRDAAPRCPARPPDQRDRGTPRHLSRVDLPTELRVAVFQRPQKFTRSRPSTALAGRATRVAARRPPARLRRQRPGTRV